ncbi:MAG: phytanoyl-CoA dioxygenase family protein [Pseudomonadota bacterium]
MRDGFTVVPPEILAANELCAALLGAVLLRARTGDESPDINRCTEYLYPDNPAGQQLFYLLAQGRPFVEAVEHPSHLALVKYLIHDAIVSSVTASLKGPGKVALPLHADQPVHPSPRSLVCTSAFLLTPMSPALGGLCFVPGSHNQLTQPPPSQRSLTAHSNLASITAPAGSLVVWHANTWHGAHPRSKPGIRVALLVHWCSSILRPQEPYRELLSDEIIAAGSEGFPELLGSSIQYGWTAEGPERAPGAAFTTARARKNANTDCGR